MITPIHDLLLDEVKDFVNSVRSSFSDEELQIVQERLTAYATLQARIATGESNLGEALKITRMSLDLYRTANGVAVGSAFTSRALAILAAVFAAAFSALKLP